MYRIAIVDDDGVQRRALRDMLEELVPDGVECSIGLYGDLDELEGGPVDIAFVDILLRDGANGIEEVLEHFSDTPKVQVIYVTGYVEYCSAVYDTSHIGFLVKPVKRQELSDAFHRALERLHAVREQPFAVRFKTTTYAMHPSQVMYVESKLRLAYFHCINAYTVRTYMKLSDIVDRLPARFHHCHSSYLVNLDFVKAITKTDFILSDDTHVPISHRRWSEANDAFWRHLESNAD
ncbi:DNA-binding response regulator [Bifidobacterium pseudolongum subsp. globosum]|uniref:DNA-binding response regulator n=1 Tax=Bifidobacterium pseudolongum subsp. globosum TaxID=1690 RepID=A0A4Q5AFT4_9BIFI|nr:LytTR family DNA-binding domain-containing protein [Bifidobacterium pseudolongum]RYQ26617.1 DNA-binding response regulator [Bifidobacterium pseudolongum subsp. globosum]RYQ28609.1 DNA-binding response regulator [Bifidobacterium pseudolongum subsp. globosum]